MTPITHGLQVTLDAGTNDLAIYSRSGREYFPFENRSRAGRDAALPDEGLAIWHVDEDGDNSHEHMMAGSHYELSLEQADGLFQVSTPNRAIPENNQLGITDAIDISRRPDDLERQGGRRYLPHLSRRPERHADDPVGHRHRTAPEGSRRSTPGES